MSEKILIPLDGSELGEAALRYVEELVSRLSLEKKIEAILFQAITAWTYRPGTSAAAIEVPYTKEQLEELKKRAMDYLDKAGEGLRSKGVIVGCKVAVGETSANEIIKAGDEVNADLVAMSTHGRHGVSRWALGSVADKVLRGSQIPVIMVRARKDTANI